MSANDSAMTRFLYAILEQKCLKDIDWTKVAHNPILPQPITNGHAARMRFSRFRQSLLGIEAKPRNRTKDNKNRVTKSKKDVKGKKSTDDEDIKGDPDAQEAEETATKTESPRVKQEMSQLPHTAGYNSNYGNTTAPMHAPDMYSQLHSRLLTPCSDSDAMASSSSYGASPHGEMLHSEPSFCHEHAGWALNNPYPSYGMQYGLDSYSGAYPDHSPHLPSNDQLDPQHHQHFCGGELGSHQHTQLTGEEMRVPEALMDAGDSQVTVKHEDWASSPF